MTSIGHFKAIKWWSIIHIHIFENMYICHIFTNYFKPSDVSKISYPFQMFCVSFFKSSSTSCTFINDKKLPIRSSKHHDICLYNRVRFWSDNVAKWRFKIFQTPLNFKDSIWRYFSHWKLFLFTFKNSFCFSIVL